MTQPIDALDLDSLDSLRESCRVAFPWRVEDDYGGEIISADGRYPCASAEEPGDPEHAYVVALVNAHPRLVLALREALASLAAKEAEVAGMRGVVEAARVVLPIIDRNTNEVNALRSALSTLHPGEPDHERE